MPRLDSKPIEAAEGKTAQLFATIRAAVGKVPNALADLGNNSPVTLEAALTLDGALRKSSLSTRDIEAIKLAVSEAVGCDYCLAAHTLIAQKAGLSHEAILGLRRAMASGDAKLDALARFARTLVTTRGTVPTEVVDAVKAGGYNDAQIADTMLAIASITLTNLFNRVNDTVLDFPAAAAS